MECVCAFRDELDSAENKNNSFSFICNIPRTKIVYTSFVFLCPYFYGFIM